MIRIQVETARGEMIAQAEHPEEALLCLDREWEAGDRVKIITEPDAHVMVRMNVTLPEAEVYLPAGVLTWHVPVGEERLAYAPGAFEGKRHLFTARCMAAEELAAFRDLARNPADLRGETDFFPHCTANVETRGEAVFAARNVIDGLRFNTSHGEWPFESWGIGAREDAWCRVDFGREVVISRMALTLRADFPHDAYWASGRMVDSVGGEVAFRLKKTGERQWIDLGERRVRWLRLERMEKSDDPSAFPSLRAWEVFGRDLPV